MKPKVWMILARVMVCCALPLAAQQPQQKEMSAEEKAAMAQWQTFMTPSEGHKMLDGMVGTFDATVKMWMQPGAPPTTSTGVSRNEWVLGKRYIQENFSGTFMNTPFQGIGYTGYDNGKKVYVGTWIDNMGTGVMTSTGTTTDNGKTWTFKSVSTDPMTGKDTPGESRITVADNDHHTMEMWGPAPDGKMFKMMQIDYTRRSDAKK
ncbi:MAG: DUF1579 domain-containing protein [Thermoanaerobaculia bacterium]